MIPTADVLIPAATKRFRFLVADHGFRQENEVGRWGTTVKFHGEVWTLTLFYGEREFDFFAEIKYHAFPRRNPKPLWAVLEAMGLERPDGPETRVSEARCRRLVAETAESVTRHWDALNRAPDQGLFHDIEEILDRASRRVRSGR